MLDVDGVIDQTTMNEVLRYVLYIALSPSCYQLKIAGSYQNSLL